MYVFQLKALYKRTTPISFYSFLNRFLFSFYCAQQKAEKIHEAELFIC